MRWVTIILALSLMVSCASSEWSWENDPDRENDPDINTDDDLKSEATLEEERLTEQQDKRTILDDIVDELMKNQQGRSLGDFEDVYGEPTIKYALENGNNDEARNLIKDRLCTLGLMQCDEGTDEKHYVSPGELIYAQPVDIKPVGKPIASIPIRGPPRAYGSPKPVPRPTRVPYNKIPPTRIAHRPTYPGFADKYGQVSTGSYQGGIFTGFNDNKYATRPSQHNNEDPYTFDTSKPTYNKVPPTPSHPPKHDAPVQQHVHHHYVHSDAEKDPKVIIKPVGIPVGSVGSLTTPTGHQDIITAGDVDYPTSGFRPMSSSYTVNSKPPTDTVYGNQYASIANHNNGHNNYLQNPSDYSNYGNSLSSNNKDFYKKELNLGGSGLYNQGPATFSDTNSFIENYHETKAQGIECICVDYDQCPSEEIIGRRDDLYLPIDPRNKQSEIVALTDEQLDNVTKIENKNTTVDIESKERNTESEESSEESDTGNEPKKISKREAVDDEGKEEKKEIEARFIGLSGYGGNNGGNPNKQVQPTFGVSFGLPQPSHGGYPINPYGPNPLYNPYGPALNSGGLNLGLISVNPLLSVQVTKNDYGEKVIKPFVNLHVTPNEHVVNKLGHLIHEKKHYLLNKHHHYHHHQYKPVPAVGHLPFVQQDPSHYGPPVYSPHHPHYAPAGYFKDPIHTPQFASNHNDDYYDDDDDIYNDHPIDPYQGGYNSYGFERSANNSNLDQNNYANRFAHSRSINLKTPHNSGATRGSQTVKFPTSRKRRDTSLDTPKNITVQERQGYFGRPPVQRQQCKANQVCCRRPLRPQAPNKGQCGIRHSQGVNGRVKTPSYVDGNSEFGEYPWQVAILKKDPKESVYVCGGTLIDGHHIITAAHCVKSYNGHDLRIRLGEWDVNHDVEFYPYIERDVSSVHIHPQYYAGTLDNDIAILKMEHAVDWTKYPHISPACLPDKYTDYAGQRCWTTGWGKDAFGDYGKYQNILNEVDVPILGHGQCQQQLRQTRLGYNYELNPGFLCAGGEEGKDACKGDGGGPLVCERGGTWQVVGVVSWGIGCGQPGIPGVYVKVAHYLDWIQQTTGRFSHF